MKRKTTYLFTTLLLIVLESGFSFLVAQLSSMQADAVKPLSYKNYPLTDKLFVFYQSNGTFQAGDLVASGPVAGVFTFNWTQYDADADAFSIALKTDNSVATSSISNLDEGGYRVHVTNGADVDTTFTAWVMLDNFEVLTIKDALGQVPYGESACPDGINWIRVSGSVSLDDSFYYFDLQTHDTLRIKNDYTIEWTSDNPDLIIPNPTNTSTVGGNYSLNPPVQDTWYILSATDSLGMTGVDSVFYETKFTKAEFSVSYWDKINDTWDPDLNRDFSLSTGSLDAPLSVQFINESQNGSEFEWVFLDTIESSTGFEYKESISSISVDESPEFTYYNADKYYYPYLVSISEEGCRDTFKLEDGIEVVAAQLDVPNVFSPDSYTEDNRTWRFKHQSIKEFKVTITDRSGKVVYREHIYDIYDWDGWDGTIRNEGNRKAPQGVYFYVIEGLGYDLQEFKVKNYLQRRKDEKQAGTSTTTTGDEETQTNPYVYIGWLYLFRAD
mgnify:CR=1 FL=1